MVVPCSQKTRLSLASMCSIENTNIAVFQVYIYSAEDKNNENLNRAMMGRFRRFVNDVELKEIPLIGRRYTWSNEREAPTLVKLDRVLCTSDWEDTFPDCILQSQASQISDHCPLLLGLREGNRGKRRFHFESFWTKFPDFHEIVAQPWE